MYNRPGFSGFILFPCHIIKMVRVDYRGLKENLTHVTSKAIPFTIEREERKSSWEMVYEKKSNFKA